MASVTRSPARLDPAAMHERLEQAPGIPQLRTPVAAPAGPAAATRPPAQPTRNRADAHREFASYREACEVAVAEWGAAADAAQEQADKALADL